MKIVFEIHFIIMNQLNLLLILLYFSIIFGIVQNSVTIEHRKEWNLLTMIEEKYKIGLSATDSDFLLNLTSKEHGFQFPAQTIFPKLKIVSNAFIYIKFFPISTAFTILKIRDPLNKVRLDIRGYQQLGHFKQFRLVIVYSPISNIENRFKNYMELTIPFLNSAWTLGVLIENKKITVYTSCDDIFKPYGYHQVSNTYPVNQQLFYSGTTLYLLNNGEINGNKEIFEGTVSEFVLTNKNNLNEYMCRKEEMLEGSGSQTKKWKPKYIGNYVITSSTIETTSFPSTFTTSTTGSTLTTTKNYQSTTSTQQKTTSATSITTYQPKTTTESTTILQPTTTTESTTTLQPTTSTESTTTSQPATTTESTTTLQPTTSTESNTTSQPTTSTESTTILQPTTSTESTTTSQPTTSTESNTTSQPTTTTESTTILQPTTSTESTTTSQPTTTTEFSTTSKPTTTTESTATLQPTTSTESTTTSQPTTTTEFSTTSKLTTTTESTTTLQPTTSTESTTTSQPTTSTESTTTSQPTTTTESTTTLQLTTSTKSTTTSQPTKTPEFSTTSQKTSTESITTLQQTTTKKSTTTDTESTVTTTKEPTTTTTQPTISTNANLSNDSSNFYKGTKGYKGKQGAGGLNGSDCECINNLRFDILQKGVKGEKGGYGQQGERGTTGMPGKDGKCLLNQCNSLPPIKGTKGDRGETGYCSLDNCKSNIIIEKGVKGDKGEQGIKEDNGDGLKISDVLAILVPEIKSSIDDYVSRNVINMKGEPGSCSCPVETSRGEGKIKTQSIVLNDGKTLKSLSFNMPVGQMVFLIVENILLVKIDDVKNRWRIVKLESAESDWYFATETQNHQTLLPTFGPISSMFNTAFKLMLIALPKPTGGDLRSDQFEPGAYSGSSYLCQKQAYNYGLGRAFYPLLNTDMFDFNYLLPEKYRYGVPVVNRRNEKIASSFTDLLKPSVEMQASILDFRGDSIMSEINEPCVWIGEKPSLYEDKSPTEEGLCLNWMSKSSKNSATVTFLKSDKALLNSGQVKSRPCNSMCYILCMQIYPLMSEVRKK